MGWRDWLNSGGLFGGYGEYGSTLQQPSLDRAKKYGMAAAAAQLMNTNPYDTRYGTNLFGSILAGKMAMREQLEAEQEAAVKARLLEEKAKRDAQEWEWKKAEAERKDREFWENEQKPDDAFVKDATEEHAQANLWATRTGKDPNIFLGLPKVARDAELKKLTIEPKKPKYEVNPKGFGYYEDPETGDRKYTGKREPGYTDDEPKKKEKVPDRFAEATRIYRSEKTDEVDPITGKVVKIPAFKTFAAALVEADKRIAAATGAKPTTGAEPTTGASPLAAFAKKGLEETGDEGKVLAGLIAKGYTKAEAIAAIEEAKRLR